MYKCCRKKRAANETDDFHEMTISEAIADIRKRKGYKMGFDDENQDNDRDSSEEAPRRKQSCVQTEDCLNDIEYAVFQKVYHNSRTKREVGLTNKNYKILSKKFQSMSMFIFPSNSKLCC